MPHRWLTSCMARCEGVNLLIDCGEGTQIAMKEKGWSPKPIDIICFTHYHADHIAGLPGLLLSMANAEKNTPLILIGPRGLERVVGALRVICPELPFDIKYIELTESTEHLTIAPYVIDAFKVNHNITCYGYRLSIPRSGKFDADKARELNIPVEYWNKLQHGETVTIKSSDTTAPSAAANVATSSAAANAAALTITPDVVMGPPRRGISMCYTTDTRPTATIAEYAKDTDLFICEGMYGEPDKADKARGYKHMTMFEAAELAVKAQPKELWLTHYSPSVLNPREYKDAVRAIFPNTVISKDGRSIDLGYEE